MSEPLGDVARLLIVCALIFALEEESLPSWLSSTLVDKVKLPLLTIFPNVNVSYAVSLRFNV